MLRTRGWDRARGGSKNESQVFDVVIRRHGIDLRGRGNLVEEQERKGRSSSKGDQARQPELIEAELIPQEKEDGLA